MENQNENKSDNTTEEDELDSASEDYDFNGYCPECGACGIDGCCDALMCAYKNIELNVIFLLKHGLAI